MSILKNSGIYMAGELFSKMLPFLLLPYLSRKLGVEEFGELSYYQTFLVVALLIISLNQEGAVARYFYFYGKRSLHLIIHTGYIYSLFTTSIMLLIGWYLQSSILSYIILASLFQNFLNVQLIARQSEKNAIGYTMIQFLSGFITVLFTVALLEYYQTDLVEKRILAIFFSNVVVFLIAYMLYASKHKIKNFSFKYYKLGFRYILGFGLPLILHNASMLLRGQLDRIFIYHQFSEKDLGLYAMGATVASIVSVGIMAINKATIPYYYESLKKGKLTLAKIHQWTLLSLLFVPIPAIVMWIIPESLVAWLFGEQFLGTKYYIILFLITTTLSIPYLLLVNYLFYYGKNKWISACSILTTVIYMLSLLVLLNFKIDYVPFASIIGAVVILPILWLMTSRVKV